MRIIERCSFCSLDIRYNLRKGVWEHVQALPTGLIAHMVLPIRRYDTHSARVEA